MRSATDQAPDGLPTGGLKASGAPRFWPVLLLLLGTSLPLSAAARDAVPGRLADLAWMTGSWVGPFGERTLEETWIDPADGTLACLVRLTRDGSTEMIELILIEQAAESLVFRVRQWLPGFVPRQAEPQRMVLAELGERRVSFAGTANAEFRTLTYSSPSDDTFNIDVETQAGETFQINLKARP